MIIYETINTLNGKRYIGKDIHNNPKYLGSGKTLTKAITKYGRDNFLKTILEHCTDETHLNEREIHWITITNAQKSRKYYNIAPGGQGGDNITLNPNRDEFINKMNVVNQHNRMHDKTHSTETKQLQKQKAKGRYTLDWFCTKYGHSRGLAKYKERNEQLSKRDLKGSNNPAYVHIDKDELEYVILTTDLGLNKLCEHFKVGNTSMYNRLQDYFGMRKVKDVRIHLIARNCKHDYIKIKSGPRHVCSICDNAILKSNK